MYTCRIQIGTSYSFWCQSVRVWKTQIIQKKKIWIIDLFHTQQPEMNTEFGFNMFKKLWILSLIGKINSSLTK